MKLTPVLAALTLVAATTPALAAPYLQLNPSLFGMPLGCQAKPYPASQHKSDINLVNLNQVDIAAGTRVVIIPEHDATITVPIPRALPANGSIILPRVPITAIHCQAHTEGRLQQQVTTVQ